MPSTVPQGFPYPVPNDTPDVPRDVRALAEALDTKLTALDSAISDLQTRATALEDGTGGSGMIAIGTGNNSGSDFTIDLTAGGKFPSPPLWNLVKIYMRFDLNATGYVECRINGDSDAVYRSSGLPIDALGNNDSQDGWHFDDGLAWRIGHGGTVSTNNLDFTIYHTAANPGLLNFQATSGRQSDDPSAHRYTISHGSLISTKTASSLFFQPVSGASTFVNAWWWAFGMRMEHPS